MSEEDVHTPPDKSGATGRLAFRQEGDFWKAYYALPGTMEGAILLGSVCMAAVAAYPLEKQAFIDFMKRVVTLIVKDAVGDDLNWPHPPYTAPDHERTS